MKSRDLNESPLGTAYEMVSQFVDTTEAQRFIMAMWAAHTHIYDRFVASPRLSFVAEGPGTGKSVAMNVALSLSNEPLAIGYASQASVYSYLEEHPRSTLGLDEVDKIFGIMGRKTSRAVLAAVVNDGYSSSGRVMVMRSNRAVMMPVYAPVATAGIGQLPEDTRTRALEIRLERGSPTEMYIPELHAKTMEAIGHDLCRWAGSKEARKSLDESEPVAQGVKGPPRFRLIMGPLVAIADAMMIGDAFRDAVHEWQTGETDLVIPSAAEQLAALVRPLLTEELQTASELAEQLRTIRPDIPQGRLGATYVASLLREVGIDAVSSNGHYGYRASE